VKRVVSSLGAASTRALLSRFAKIAPLPRELTPRHPADVCRARFRVAIGDVHADDYRSSNTCASTEIKDVVKVDLTKRGSLNDVLRWMIIDGIGEKKIDAPNRPDRYTIIDTQIRREERAFGFKCRLASINRLHIRARSIRPSRPLTPNQIIYFPRHPILLPE